MILIVEFTTPPAVNVHGFTPRAKVNAIRDDNGRLYVIAPKSGAKMMVKQINGRFVIRTMTKQTIVVFVG